MGCGAESRASRLESAASGPESRTSRPENRACRQESKTHRPQSTGCRPENRLDFPLRRSSRRPRIADRQLKTPPPRVIARSATLGPAYRSGGFGALRRRQGGFCEALAQACDERERECWMSPFPFSVRITVTVPRPRTSAAAGYTCRRAAASSNSRMILRAFASLRSRARSSALICIQPRIVGSAPASIRTFAIS